MSKDAGNFFITTIIEQLCVCDSDFLISQVKNDGKAGCNMQMTDKLKGTVKQVYNFKKFLILKTILGALWRAQC